MTTKNRIRKEEAFINEAQPLLQFWVASVLRRPAAWRAGHCIMAESFDKPHLLEILGLNKSAIRKRKTPPPDLDRFIPEEGPEGLFERDDLYRNFHALGEELGLTEAEVRLCTLVCHNDFTTVMTGLFELLDIQGQQNTLNFTASLLGVPAAGLLDAIKPRNTLRRTELLSANTRRMGMNVLDGLSVDREVSSLIMMPDTDPGELTRVFYRLAGPAALEAEDYVHVDQDYRILSVLLRDAIQNRRKGVNFLVHGDPGTGKTQLTHLLAKELDLNLAIVPELDQDGDPIPGWARLGRLQACQIALRNNKKTFVLFDEVEDTLDAGETPFFMPARRQVSKSSLIQALEENPLPVFWITNKIKGIDPAIQRRFAYVMRLDSPGPAQRRKVVDKHLADLPVSESWRKRAAAIGELSPAILASAAEIGMRCHQAGLEPEDVMSRSIDARLDALGSQQRMAAREAPLLPWRPECLTASDDVAGLMHEISPDSNARLCLYGPPGTGKTAWARQLAEQLEKPLLVKRASDLLDPYVGMTERRIDEAFRNAENDGAVLLIDEADSFLDDRSNARQSWEVSRVNQFLTAMEQFRGIFVATTNFMDRVDEAAMRRFDFRIEFHFLEIDAATTLFMDLAAEFGIDIDDRGWLQKQLSYHQTLTPGDFAAIARNLSVRRTKPDAEGLLELLARECSYKEPTSRPIGFIQ